MKRIMIILFTLGLITMGNSTVSAMSESRVRSEALFLTDRMAYELNLNNRQLDDVFEINYDFIYSVQNIMPNVMRGETWAVNRYYALLDFRNEDLRWVLSDSQFRRFMNAEHFYRPIYASSTGWSFRIRLVYTNSNFFYFGRPQVYVSHRYNPNRPRYSGSVSPYRNRHHHTVFSGKHSVRQNNNFNRDKQKDFGPVVNRPGNSSNATVNRPSSNNTNDRPSGHNANRQTTTSNRSNTTGSTENNRTNSTTNTLKGNSNKTNQSGATGTATKPASTTNNREATSTNSNNSSTVRRSATEQRRSSAATKTNASDNKNSTSKVSRNTISNTNTSRTSTQR